MSSIHLSFIVLHGILLEDSSRILDDLMEVKRVIVRNIAKGTTDPGVDCFDQ